MTVKDACDHYVKHLGLHKGSATKADAEGRFKRLVYDDKITQIDLSRLRTSHLKDWLANQIDSKKASKTKTICAAPKTARTATLRH